MYFCKPVIVDYFVTENCNCNKFIFFSKNNRRRKRQWKRLPLRSPSSALEEDDSNRVGLERSQIRERERLQTGAAGDAEGEVSDLSTSTSDTPSSKYELTFDKKK